MRKRHRQRCHRAAVSVAYYDYKGTGTAVVSAGLNYQGASLSAEYYIPKEGFEARGLWLKASYTHEWDKLSLTGSLIHAKGPYDGVPDYCVVAGLKGEYALDDHWTVSLSGQVPLAKKSSDERQARAVASLTWSF
ncbi:MAG: hypothetical protein WDN67_04235 [Candidatus Moraniibacteriota bacterium]